MNRKIYLSSIELKEILPITMKLVEDSKYHIKKDLVFLESLFAM